MDFWKKVRDLKILKKKKFRVILFAELFLLLVGIAGLFGKDEVYHFDLGTAAAEAVIYSEEHGGLYVDASMEVTGAVAEFRDISLRSGVYAVSLSYETDTNMENLCTVTDSTAYYKSLLTNGEHLYSGLTHTDFNMWLLVNTDTLIVRAEYGGTGSLVITGLTIRETNTLNRILLFLLICVSLIINGIYVYVCYDRAYKVLVEKKNVAFGLFLVILFSSLPLMTDYLLNSGDLVYHLMRIEGIKDGLSSGQFPVRIAPEWQTGYGYASSIFYCETLLFIAALFRMTGFTVLTSYRMFFILINGATALAAYHCFRKMFTNRYIGLLCSALYTLSVYRIYKTYGCGSFGETFGILFLPFIVYGFYRVFTEDIHSKEYKKSFIPLMIGFTGLIQSHLLSGELAGAFTILLCIILWKKVFRKETFLVLAKTVIYSAMLSVWFLVPFLDYMITGDFVIQHVSARTIQERGLYPAHLLFSWFISGGTVFFEENGMYKSDPMGIGIALLAALILWGFLLFFRKTGRLAGKDKKLGQIAAAFSLLAMCMSLSVFPWDKIQFMNGIFQTLVSSIQFPNRFLTIASVLLVTLAGVVGKCILEMSSGESGRQDCRQDGRRWFALYFSGMVVLLCISSIYLLNDMLYSRSFTRIYNSEGMGTGYISGAEYLPYGTDASLLTYRGPVAEENVEVEGYEKGALRVDVSCYNNSDREGFLELPLLYYKGYRAWDEETGEALTVYAGNNHAVSVAVPSGYHGVIRTEFVSPWYWRVAEVLSVVTFLFLVLWYGYNIALKPRRQIVTQKADRSGR